ncbi:PLP-dependent aminotransferase family protein [Conexibacter sp. SYSU D00693]|uniref:aminotransferase-like domain-containing protein n=1 Tax=Conexibacter sp. SYSU D00693 TaxID=2812560 RepID=UPI00196B587A|nr:PLP-dependent aminotransferase family protein [Conexibacter sp. SYSU D00693]
MSEDNTRTRVIDDLRATAASLSPGTKLPSVRELMARHRASPVTVQRAISALAAEGVVEPRPGRGTFVAQAPVASVAVRPPDLAWQDVALADRPPVPGASLQQLLGTPPPGAVTLTNGYLEPALQPVGPAGQALARAARRADAWERPPLSGLEELRAWFAREAGGFLHAHDVVVTSGAQAALSTAFRALAAPGDVVLLESPTYHGAVAAARAAGLRVVPVPADAGGVRPDLLAEALRRTGARIAYLQPLWANPHGATLAPERRAAVMEAVAAAGAFLVEDDWSRDFAIDHDAPPPLAADDPDGHVVLIRSLSKVAAPGLRVAAALARGTAGARLRAARLVDDFFVSGVLQLAALELVSSPGWRRHLRALRPALRERRDTLVAALAEHAPDARPVAIPSGGLHLWLALPDGVDDEELATRAAAEGVTVSPGRLWFAAEAPGPHLRVTHAAAAPADLAEGAKRLGRALAAVAR